MKLIVLLWMLLSISLSFGCGSRYRIREFEIGFTRPANQDGMKVNVITGEYRLIPKTEWKRLQRKAIILELKDWIEIKKTLYEPCIKFKCAHELDLISGAFEKLDETVGKLFPN